jgi:hypothetical protein
MTQATKTVVSIERSAPVIAFFGDVAEATSAAFRADGNESAKIQKLAQALAGQVESLALPLSSKIALVKATYAQEFAGMASTKDLDKQLAKRKSNAVAALVAALTCYIAADTPVETKAPAEGKPAEFKKAGELSLSAQRAAAAEVKKVVADAEKKSATEAAIAAMTPEQKKATELKLAEIAAATAANVAKERQAAQLATATALVGSLAVQLDFIMTTPETNAKLNDLFAAHGFEIKKSKRAPAERGTLADQLKSLAK